MPDKPTNSSVTRWIVAGIAIGGVMTIAPSSSFAAGVAFSGTGKLTVTSVAGEPVRLTCGGGVVQLIAQATQIPCAAVRQIVITGTTGDDIIDLTGVTGATFNGLNAGRAVVVDSREGADNISMGSVPATLRGGIGNDQIAGGAADDVIYGGAGDDSITAGAGADVVYGEVGNDTIVTDATKRQPDSAVDNSYGGIGTDKVYVTNDDRADAGHGADADDVTLTLTTPSTGSTILGAATYVQVEAKFASTWTIDYISPAPQAPSLFLHQLNGANHALGNPLKINLILSANSDVVRVTQNPITALTIDAGTGVGVDKLSVDVVAPAFTDDGATIASTGYATIAYKNFETKRTY